MQRRHRLSLLAAALAAAIGSIVPVATATASEQGTVEVREVGSVGTVSGRVREAARGIFLEGARVTIDGRSAVTDREGRFRVTGLAPGRYEVVVDFVGYATERFTVDLGPSSGAGATITLRSTVAPNALGVIEVRASRDSQALALNLQRSSQNLRNVVSADLLGRFPDVNLAEATQRIPGVSIERDQGEGRYVNLRGAPLEFTQIAVDGVPLSAPNPRRRTVELDTIPSDVIAALEVSKAITPDMDGDAIAGQINIVTQSALERGDGFLRASVGSGRYELGPGDNDRANLTAGMLVGEAENVGVLVSASASRAGRFTDNAETEFFRAPDGRILPLVLQVKDYDGTRTRAGLTARFDARIAPEHLLYFVASGSKFRDKEFRNTLVLELEQHRAGASQTRGEVGRATFDKELRERIQEQRIRTANFGGEHDFEDWRLEWQASRTSGRFDIPTRQQWIVRSTLRPPLRYDYSDPDFPIFTVLNPDGTVRQQGLNLPENLYAFRRYNQRFEDAKESETGLRADLGRAQSWLGESGSLRFGVRARLRDKRSNDDRNRNSVAAGTPPYPQLLCPRVSNNFGRFEFGRVFCNDIFERFGGTVRNQNLLPLVADSIVSDYTAAEDIYAAYVRLDADWDRLGLVTGVRHERTSTSASGFVFRRANNSFVAQTIERDYVKWLPSAHFRYEIDEDSLLRWSYSTGISRPNFIDLAPRFVLAENERSAIAGNPDVKATWSQNLDLSYERYLRPLGLVSIAAFYKRLDDPIFLATSARDGILVTRPENGPRGRITGVELAWQQTFDQLPAPFDGLGVYANYTYADSSADLPFGLGRTDLPGTSRDNVNVAVFYEKRGFNARLAYNYRSRYIQEFNVDDRDLDIFWDARPVLDFTTSYQISPRWQIFGELNNITDSKQRRLQGDRSRVFEIEQFGRFWLVGARVEL